MRGNGVRVFPGLEMQPRPLRVSLRWPCGPGLPRFGDGAARRGGLLSLLVQRKKQRNTPQAARPALRSGSASGPGISVRHIHVPYGNAVIHDGALRVLPGPLTAPHGDPKASKSKVAASDVSDVALGAPEVRQSRRVKPRRGGAQGCAPFSYGAGCPARKFPPGLRTRRAAAGGPPGGVSFAYFSLHKQRKVGPPRQAAPCLKRQDISGSAARHLSAAQP